MHVLEHSDLDVDALGHDELAERRDLDRLSALPALVALSAVLLPALLSVLLSALARLVATVDATTANATQ